jgi:prepilin-type N-terminal cleavage/methylation domain-containing protein
MRSRTPAAGFTLIEMMIAMVLGLFVVGGLITVLVANKKSYELQQGNTFNQQTLRFGMSRLDWSLRMADFWGGVKSGDVSGSPSDAGLGGGTGCDAAWTRNVKQGLYGYEGGTSFPVSGCVKDANYVPGSDVLVVRYAGTHGYDPAASLFSAVDVSDATSLYLVAGVGQQGSLFRKGEAVPSSPLGDSIGRFVYTYQLEMYYLRPCSDPGGDGDCGTADDGDAASRVPTLVRMRMDDTGKLVSEPVVDGIEMMKFEYAPGEVNIATGYYRPHAYVAASALTDDKAWMSVIAVRASIVARSLVRDTSVPQTGIFHLSQECEYEVPKTGAVTFRSLTATNVCADLPPSTFGDRPQQFSRTQATSVIQVRNRIRG